MSDAANKRLGDYEILDVLGAGGMGRVYKVRNTITDRVEAIKVLLPDLQGHEQLVARFLREIKVLAALKHPNIAGLLTALTIDNQLVMVMEYVEGQSISGRLQQGAIPVPEALRYLDQVLDALSYAHRQKVIHRDIKPANIMLTNEGTVKLMDFGIARSNAEPQRLTATGSTLGSLSYMSPEQVRGEAIDERSDLYSLGISLYEMVTGQKPFQGDSDFSIMAAQISQAPTPPVHLQPGLPLMVNDIILKSIAKEPEQRYQSADAFRHALKRVLDFMQSDRTMVQGSQEFAAAGAPVPADRTMVQGSQEYQVSGQAAPAPVRGTMPVAPPVPVAAAVAAPPPPAASHRGLYMGLGALVVVVVLIAAGLYMPGWKKASAADALGPASQPPVTAASPGVQTSRPAEQANPVEQSQPADARSKQLVAKNAAPPPASGRTESAAPAPNTAELDAIEHEIDQLTSRAAAVNNSLDTMRRQQEAEGYGLRGDIASKQTSMKINLSKAQTAIEQNDAARAKRYAGMASTDVEALERFLGR